MENEKTLKGFVTQENESYINFALITKHARETLKGQWVTAVLVALIYLILSAGTSVVLGQINVYVGNIVTFIIAGPLALGLMTFVLSISRKQNAEISQIFAGFKNFVTALLTYLLMLIFIILWMLLLIVPGIIKGLAYSMTFFILVDDENIKPLQAITKSKEMMKGHKFELFCLQLRFFGWGMLALLTAAIGFLWLLPYINVSYAKFYDDLKATQE